MEKLTNDIADDSITPQKSEKSMFLRITLYLPMLAGPVAICTVIIFYCVLRGNFCGIAPTDESTRGQMLNNWVTVCELISPWILLVTLMIYWCKAVYTRNLTYVIISVITACLLLRELHWDHTIKIVIFPLLGFCFLWMFLWRDIVDAPRANWSHTVFFIAALVTYGLGQLIEKRVFKFCPVENVIHTQLEETVECAGHLLLFMASVFGSWRRGVINVSKKEK